MASPNLYSVDDAQPILFSLKMYLVILQVKKGYKLNNLMKIKKNSTFEYHCTSKR